VGGGLRPVRGTTGEVLERLRAWEAADDPDPLIVETSGSTGRPKRVVLSRAAMRASADATHARLGGPGQWLLRLPPTYVAGLQVLFRSVRAGTEPAEELSAMTGERGYLSLVPTQLVRVLDRGEDLSGLDAVLVGGAGLEPRLRSRAEAAGLRIVTTYGMSETCGGCVYDGVPLDGVRVSTTAEGRVRIGGDVLFDRYDGQPDLTAASKVDGWFLTQDLGRVREDGRLEVLGRVDDVVVSGGVNVPTAAVAGRLREHPRVREAEVVGVPAPEWGRQVVAVLAVGPDEAPDEGPEDGPHEGAGHGLGLAEVRDWVGARYPRAWAPRRVVPVAALPLLANGKVDRQAVERLAAVPASRSGA